MSREVGKRCIAFGIDAWALRNVKGDDHLAVISAPDFRWQVFSATELSDYGLLGDTKDGSSDLESYLVAAEDGDGL
jgi:hypothetical protein